jgi:hypothetical protein
MREPDAAIPRIAAFFVGRHCCTGYEVLLTYLDETNNPTNAPTPLYPDAL